MEQKSSQILEELDIARCRAQWTVVSELIKKYKKVKPEDLVHETTISTEIKLIQLLNTHNTNWDIIHEKDTPDKISLIDPIDPIKVENLSNALIALNLDEEGNWQKQFSKIILARVYFESGQYDKAFSALQNLALRAEDVRSGYGLVLLVQARAMKGICLEKQQQDEAAVEAYEAAWNVVEAQPQEKGAMLSFWTEECLYRSTLLRLRLNHSVVDTLNTMRAYVKVISSHWSPQWRMYRRWVVLSKYAEYFIQSYQDGSYPNTIPKSANSLSDEKVAIEELSVLMGLYRDLFTLLSPHLEESSRTQYGLSLAYLTMNAYDIIGWGETVQIKRVLQFLYQVKNVTFNHPTVSRFIFFTLMRLGSLEEAKIALRSYLELLGLPDFSTDAILDDTPKNNTEASAGSHDLQTKDHVTDPAKPHPTFKKAERILKTLQESPETVTNVIQVLLASVYLYGQEEQEGQTAAILADLAHDLVQQTPELQTEVYRARGTAYGLLATHCDDPEDRQAHHTTAIESLTKATELDPTDWKAQYNLGLQHALMRNLQSATAAIKTSLELNPHHPASWHLLSLITSCRRSDRLPAALKSLEIGLDQTSPPPLPITHLPAYSWQSEPNASQLFDQAETYLSMRMSRLGLLEAMEGPEAVMDHYEDLFQLYGQLTHQLGLTGALTIPTTPVEEVWQAPVVTMPRKASFMRRASISSVTSSQSRLSLGRPRASSVEEGRQSDTDEVSDSSRISRRSLSRRPKPSLAKSIHQQQQYQQEVAAEQKKRNLQLIDLGLARRIGSAVASQSQHQLGSVAGSEATGVTGSLASLFTPSYSKGSLRSNSVSSRTSSIVMQSKVVTKDGALVSTFNQHHQAFEIRKKTHWHSLLVKLWLMSSQTFKKAGLLDEARKSLEEAEQLGLGDPEVWYQLGQLSQDAVAHDAYTKALVLDPEHVPSQVAKALLLTESDPELAEVLLEEITKGQGWDSAEAWVAYAQLKKKQGQLSRVKTCLLYALELNETEPIRNLSILPKFIL